MKQAEGTASIRREAKECLTNCPNHKWVITSQPIKPCSFNFYEIIFIYLLLNL